MKYQLTWVYARDTIIELSFFLDARKKEPRKPNSIEKVKEK